MSNEYIVKGAKSVQIKNDFGMSYFSLFKGGKLKNVNIAYETWGKLSINKDNAILVFTGLSPSSHAASSSENPDIGWWEYMIGKNKPIDTNRYFVICINSLGSCYGSTSPASINPDTKGIYGLDFPTLSIEDISKAGLFLLNELGIDSAHTVVGPSMGGMSALAFALMYPENLENLILISTAARTLPFTISIRSLQREIIRNDPLWKNGKYKLNNKPLNGMRLARKLGLMSYRAANEWRERFNRARIKKADDYKMFDIEFEVESYLQHNANKFISEFDPNCYLYLSRAMDLFDVAEHGGTVKAGLSKIRTKKNLIIGVRSDILFPIDQQEDLFLGMKASNIDVQFEILDSIQGHDSFLVDEENFSVVVKKFLMSID